MPQVHTFLTYSALELEPRARTRALDDRLSHHAVEKGVKRYIARLFRERHHLPVTEESVRLPNGWHYRRFPIIDAVGLFISYGALRDPTLGSKLLPEPSKVAPIFETICARYPAAPSGLSWGVRISARRTSHESSSAIITEEAGTYVSHMIYGYSYRRSDASPRLARG
jgi:hypothetical protein